jgi:hypothetical protein|mmetsp:Transcript_24991/g.42772  ORF Transcript_24991/g.42772 Transcript_24991/m.42772 type:complete len:239 (-) Transcript_24991:259-975(-)
MCAVCTLCLKSAVLGPHPEANRCMVTGALANSFNHICDDTMDVCQGVCQWECFWGHVVCPWLVAHVNDEGQWVPQGSCKTVCGHPIGYLNTFVDLGKRAKGNLNVQMVYQEVRHNKVQGCTSTGQAQFKVAKYSSGSMVANTMHVCFSLLGLCMWCVEWLVVLVLLPGQLSRNQVLCGCCAQTPSMLHFSSLTTAHDIHSHYCIPPALGQQEGNGWEHENLSLQPCALHSISIRCCSE